MKADTRYLIFLCIWLSGTSSKAFITAAGIARIGAGKYDQDALEAMATTTITPYEVEVVSEDPETLATSKYVRENFPYYVSGFDYDGRPIFVFEIGKYDYAAALAKGGEEMEREILRYWEECYRVVEKISAQCEEENGAGEYVLIFDFDGFSLERLRSVQALKLNLQLVRNFGKLYGRLGYGFFLNANHMTLAFINTARPLFGPFLERIEIYGTRKELWLPKILRKIPRDQLPPWYGGDNKNFTAIHVFG